MPGLVLCNRRWAIGSDDIFMPAIILFIFHLIGATTLLSILTSLDYGPDAICSITMFKYLVGYLMALLMILIVEFVALVVSCQGSVLDTKPRKFIQHIIYTRLALMLVELGFIIVGIAFLIRFQNCCLQEWYDKLMKQTILIIVVLSSVLIFLLILSTTCVYDRAGKSFYQLKMIESNYRKDPLNINHAMRHLKHSHTLDLYQNSWKTRFNFLCCCIKQDDNKAAFGNIAETLSIFFYKYDVVPSDILAGLLLVYDKQKSSRISTLLQNKLGIHDYLSGVPVTESTKFFNISDKKNLSLYKDMIYFFDYAAASYGWPFYAYRDHFACFKLMPNIKNCLFSKKIPCCNNKYANSMRTISIDDVNIENDDCCFCYYDALTRQLPSADSMENLNMNKLSRTKNHVKIIRANFTSDVGKPSYYVAIDFSKKKVVITIRGTESLKDSITDMQWKAMPMPNIDPELEWYGHEGIVKAATYLKNELDSKGILKEAFDYDTSISTDKYDLMFVGHSMGGGVAAILSIMYKSEYPDVKCYCYSPPGGLLSQPCMEATKEFITTIILGKDMVPRLGMVQLEKLRNEIMEALRYSKKPKGKLSFEFDRSNRFEPGLITFVNELKIEYHHADV